MKHHNKSDLILIKEFVTEILKEEGDGGAGGIIGASYDMMPFGAHFASSSDLYNVFVKPFTDVIGVTLGKAKEMSARGVTAAKVAWETIGSTIVPWLSSEYKEIFKEQEDSIKKIREEYKEVYQATWDAFKSNDVAVTAFLCYPGLILTTVLARKTPLTALNLLGIISGGTLDNKLSQIKKHFHVSNTQDHGGKHNPLSPAGGTSLPGGYFESVLREEKKKKKTLEDVLASKELVGEAINSEYAKRMQRDARAMIHDSLNKVLSRALKALSVKNINDIESLSGKKLAGVDKVKALPQNERQTIEKTLISTTRDATKQYFIKELEAQVKSAISAGIPSESKFVKEYAKVIKKIKDA